MLSLSTIIQQPLIKEIKFFEIMLNLSIFFAANVLLRFPRKSNTAYVAITSTLITTGLFRVIVIYHTYMFALKWKREKMQLRLGTFCVSNKQQSRQSLYTNATELPNVRSHKLFTGNRNKIITGSTVVCSTDLNRG